MYDEPNLLPISALQHLIFCERQCAFIHIEQVWSDNEFTAEGNILHERTHKARMSRAPEFASRAGFQFVRGSSV